MHHGLILLVNGNLYYVLINFFAQIALFVVRALTSLIIRKGKLSGDVALLVDGSVSQTFHHVTIAIILKDAILEQLFLALLFSVKTARVDSWASRLRHVVLLSILLFFFKELFLNVLTTLLNQRFIIINVNVPAVMDRMRALHILFFLALEPGHLFFFIINNRRRGSNTIVTVGH